MDSTISMNSRIINNQVVYCKGLLKVKHGPVLHVAMQEISPWVCLEMAGLLCAHWLLNVQLELGGAAHPSPVRLGQVSLLNAAIIHTHPHRSLSWFSCYGLIGQAVVAEPGKEAMWDWDGWSWRRLQRCWGLWQITIFSLRSQGRLLSVAIYGGAISWHM